MNSTLGESLYFLTVIFLGKDFNKNAFGQRFAWAALRAAPVAEQRFNKDAFGRRFAWAVLRAAPVAEQRGGSLPRRALVSAAMGSCPEC